MNKEYYNNLCAILDEYTNSVKNEQINDKTVSELKFAILNAFELAAEYYDYHNMILKIIYKHDFVQPVNELEKTGKPNQYLPDEFVEKFLEKFLKTY